jgi:hypothetical protein
MPSQSMVFRWLAANTGFREQYAHARETQAEYWAEEIVSIADDGTNDTYLDGDGNERVNHDVINRSRLRVDTRKWLMARMAPKKYGDRIEQVQTGDPEKPVQTVNRIELVAAPFPQKTETKGENDGASN